MSTHTTHPPADRKDDECFTEEEFLARYKVCRSTAYRRRKDGTLPYDFFPGTSKIRYWKSTSEEAMRAWTARKKAEKSHRDRR